MSHHPPENGFALPIGDDLHHWSGTILGPDMSPYAGGAFHLDIRYPENYPFKPPQVKMTTKVYHPNISSRGRIGLPMLSESHWSGATYTIHIMQAIHDLLENPNPNIEALNWDATKMYKSNRAKYSIIARDWTARFALRRRELEERLPSSDCRERETLPADTSCGTLETREDCLTHLDGRNSDLCVWCPDNACSKFYASQCAPLNFLQQQEHTAPKAETCLPMQGTNSVMTYVHSSSLPSHTSDSEAPMVEPKHVVSGLGFMLLLALKVLF